MKETLRRYIFLGGEKPGVLIFS